MIVIPEHPTDGYRVHYWRLDGRQEGLVQCRATYIANKPCHEVTGCEPDRGTPYVDEWYMESRYVPSEPTWRGNGRNTTESLVEIFKRKQTDEYPEIFETFEQARVALVEWTTARIAGKEREIVRLRRLHDAFPTTWEAP